MFDNSPGRYLAITLVERVSPFWAVIGCLLTRTVPVVVRSDPGTDIIIFVYFCGWELFLVGLIILLYCCCCSTTTVVVRFSLSLEWRTIIGGQSDCYYCSPLLDAYTWWYRK